MAQISGTDGAFKYGVAGATTLSVTRWSLNQSSTTADVTTSGDTVDSDGNRWKNKIPTKVVEWSGSAEGFAEGGVDLPIIGDEVGAELVSNTLVKHAGDVIITSIDHDNPISTGEAITFTLAFEGTGTLTKTDTTT